MTAGKQASVGKNTDSTHRILAAEKINKAEPSPFS
jgi:hypothetical protein